MSRLTTEAIRQIEGLIDYYLVTEQRPEAARLLVQDVAAAWLQIEADPDRGHSHPRPYPSLARLGFRWIKARIYWIGYGLTADGPVITNVLHDSADLEGRASPSTDEPREF